jgi:transcriptional regulator with XRE-family HTH domain
VKAVDELKAWLEKSGQRQVDLAGTLGVSKVRLSRLLKGQGTLLPSKLAAIEELTGIDGLALRLAAELPRGRSRKETPPIPPAPLPPLDEDAFPPGYAAKLAQKIGDLDAEPLIAAKLKIAFGARTEAIRDRALSDLLDRMAGKAVQRTRDETPQAPVVDDALIQTLTKLATPPKPPLELVPSPAERDHA